MNKLANPKIFIKEIFYLFEYAALSQNEYYNHLAFSFVEELILSVNKAKIDRSNWSVLLISLFLTKFNKLGYFNLAIFKIYEKADKICILIVNDKQLRQEQLVLALIYLEQRSKGNKSLLSILKKNREKLSKEKLFDNDLSFDEQLRNSTLLKLLCFESNEVFYEDYISFALNLLAEKFENEMRSGVILRKMIFLFDDSLKFVSNKYLKIFIDKNRTSFQERFLLSEIIRKNNTGKKIKNLEYQKITSQIMEKELTGINFSSKLDLGFDILMIMQKNTLEKRLYYSFLN